MHGIPLSDFMICLFDTGNSLFVFFVVVNSAVVVTTDAVLAGCSSIFLNTQLRNAPKGAG